MLCHLPYGKTRISVDIPANYTAITVKPNKALAVPGETNEIERALKNPINSRRLSRIAKGGKNAVIIVSDTTRPTPTAKLLPPIISGLKDGGVEDVTIVFGL
ncbi:MAG: lactate racemase domain-containing protein, partial [Candidatus Methanoperedens sp.]